MSDDFILDLDAIYEAYEQMKKQKKVTHLPYNRILVDGIYYTYNKETKEYEPDEILARQ